MHRLGFEEKDMEQVVEILNDQTVVIARSVFSHFAGSDEKDSTIILIVKSKHSLVVPTTYNNTPSIKYCDTY